MKKYKTLINIIINFFGILSSRVLGLIRDLLSASIIGANIYSDIFFVAFKFPNLFRRIFVEGAFEQAFLPTYKNQKYKSLFAYEVFKRLFIAVVLLSIFVTIFSDFVIDIFAPGLDNNAKEFASKLLKITFWYLDFLFIMAFFKALINKREKFFATAFVPIILNITLIISLLLTKDLPKEKIIYYLSWAVVIAGILQVLFLLPSAYKLKVLKRLIIGRLYKKKIELKEFFRNFYYSLILSSTLQISAFIDTILASFLAYGSISYLYYANRVFQLPYALFTIAFFQVIFPKITNYLEKNSQQEIKKTLKISFWALFYLLLTAEIVGIISSKEIVALLFQRGEFTPKDTLITSYVLDAMLIALLPYGLLKLFHSKMLANEEHKKLAKISIISLIVKVIFSFILIFPFKVVGLALAGSIGGIVEFLLVLRLYGLREFFSFFEKKYIFLAILVIFGSIILALVFKEFLIFLKGAL